MATKKTATVKLMSRQEPERSGEDLLIRVSNGMVLLLFPEELEKFAALEQSVEETRAQRAALLQTVRDRKLTDYQDMFQGDPEKKAILEKLPPEDRQFAEAAYPEELHRYGELCRREGQAEIALGEMIRIAAERLPADEEGEL